MPHHRRDGRLSLGIPGLEERPRQGSASEVCPVGVAVQSKFIAVGSVVPWAEAGVRINAVAPGPVMTPLLQGDMDDPLTGEAVRQLKVPLGRMGEPHEIAELIAFLLGPLASWITGSIYYIDGGIDAEIRPDQY